MATYHKHRGGLDKIEEDLSAEGLAVMLTEPSMIIRVFLVILASLLVVAFAWSFYGRADVVIAAQGTVTAESEQKSVFVPIKGELVQLYVDEGHPVKEGDVLARLNSMGAIGLVGRAAEARLGLETAESKMRQWPTKRKSMEAQLSLQEKQIQAGREEYEKILAEGIAKLGEAQRLKLVKARSELQKAITKRDHALRVLEQHRRLRKTPGGGGISEQQIREKDKEFRESEIEVQLAEVALGEFEVDLGQEYTKKQNEIKKKFFGVLTLENQYQEELLQIENEERQVREQLTKARAEADLAARVKHDDIDEDNFLRIRAPADGVITRIPQNQIGAEVDVKTPLLTFAPTGARKILEVSIKESDAAFLRLGMPVKIKFNAFPYQKHGFISGTLEYLADSAFYDRNLKQMVYKARIGLDRDSFDVNRKNVDLRFGMMATAEITVQKRRLIDIALDPIRKATMG